MDQLQALVAQIQQQEPVWRQQHFAEFKQPKWLLAAKAVAQAGARAAPFLDRQQLLHGWRTWLEQTPDSVPLSLPSSLILAFSPLGVWRLTTDAAPDPQWIKSFGKLAVDVQLLVWLHLLVYAEAAQGLDPALRRLLWNAVTVIHNSPLPFVLRARFTLQAYENVPDVPVLTVPEVTALADPTALTRFTTLAVERSIEPDWRRSLFESAHLASTPPETRADLDRYLASVPSPEPAKLYPVLKKLDRQHASTIAFATGEQVIHYMLHVTRLLLLLAPARDVATQIVPELVASLLDRQATAPDLSQALGQLSVLLHLGSLMTLGQMRRAVLLFWTLASQLS